MIKIKKELGSIKGTCCDIYAIENFPDGKYITVNWYSSNGETVECWVSNEFGHSIKKGSFRLRPIYENHDTYEELIGFNAF